MDDITVTLADARACRFCMKGVRRWAEYHGVSMAELGRGLPLSRVHELDPAFADRLKVEAEKRIAWGR